MLEVLNAALEREVEILKESMMHEDEGRFTREDRDLLITLGADFKHFAERFNGHEKRFEKIEERLRELEKTVWKTIAWASGASAVVSAFVFTVLKLLLGK